VHSNDVRKLLVAIILNILITMFYSRTIKNLSLANTTVSDGVESIAQEGGGAEPARAPSKSATEYTHMCFNRYKYTLAASMAYRGPKLLVSVFTTFCPKLISNRHMVSNTTRTEGILAYGENFMHL